MKVFVNRMGKRAAILVATLALTACFGIVSDPVRHYYTLHLQPLQNPTKGHLPGLVRVRDLDCESAYDRFQMVMRRSPFELTYREREVWAVKPNRQISDLIARGLADENLFSGVTRELSERRPDYLLSGELSAIEIYDSGDVWYAHLAFSMQMTHFVTGRIVWNFSFDDRKEVPPLNFAHAVRALSELLTDGANTALDQLEHLELPEDLRNLTNANTVPPEKGQAEKAHPRDEGTVGPLLPRRVMEEESPLKGPENIVIPEPPSE